MKDALDKVIDEKKLSLCVECGKCVAGCPLAEIHSRRFSKEFSARGVIKRALMGFDVWKNKEIWFCLGCNLCAQSCPSGVRYAEFIENARELALSNNITDYCLFCERCGRCYLPIPTVEYMRGAMEERKADSHYLNLCPECRNHDFAARVRFPASSAK